MEGMLWSDWNMTFKPITNFLSSFCFHFLCKNFQVFFVAAFALFDCAAGRQRAAVTKAIAICNCPVCQDEHVCFNFGFKSKNSVSDQIILTEQWSSLAAPTNWNLDIWSFIIFLTRFLVFAIDIVCCLLRKFALKGYAGENLTFIVPSLSPSSCINKSF